MDTTTNQISPEETLHAKVYNTTVDHMPTPCPTHQPFHDILRELIKYNLTVPQFDPDFNSPLDPCSIFQPTTGTRPHHRPSARKRAWAFELALPPLDRPHARKRAWTFELAPHQDPVPVFLVQPFSNSISRREDVSLCFGVALGWFWRVYLVVLMIVDD